MQTWSSDENSVCLSVRLSVTRVHCDKTEERSVQICIPYKRTFTRRTVGRGRLLLPEILSQSDRAGAKFEQ